MENLGKFILSVIIDIVSFLVIGWIVVNLWEWFVSPLFNIRGISIPEGIGLTIISEFLFNRNKLSMKQHRENTDKSFLETFEEAVYHLITCVGVFFIGYIVQLFI